MTIAGALVVIYLSHPIGPSALGSLLYVLFVGVFLAVFVGHYFLRRQHLQDWPSAPGRIESCDTRDVLRDGSQAYVCVYMFSVDDVRQAGELCFYGGQNQLEAIKRDLIGQQVIVRYDPNDCTNSIVEDNRVNGWKVN
jgi:hypothetical protein